MRRGRALPNTACESNIKEGTAFPWPRALLLRALQINASLIFRALQGKAPHTLLKAPGPWKGWVYPPLLFPSLTHPLGAFCSDVRISKDLVVSSTQKSLFLEPQRVRAHALDPTLRAGAVSEGFERPV